MRIKTRDSTEVERAIRGLSFARRPGFESRHGRFELEKNIFISFTGRNNSPYREYQVRVRIPNLLWYLSIWIDSKPIVWDFSLYVSDIKPGSSLVLRLTSISSKKENTSVLIQ